MLGFNPANNKEIISRWNCLISVSLTELWLEERLNDELAFTNSHKCPSLSHQNCTWGTDETEMRTTWCNRLNSCGRKNNVDSTIRWDYRLQGITQWWKWHFLPFSIKWFLSDTKELLAIEAAVLFNGRTIFWVHVFSCFPAARWSFSDHVAQIRLAFRNGDQFKKTKIKLAMVQQEKFSDYICASWNPSEYLNLFVDITRATSAFERDWGKDLFSASWMRRGLFSGLSARGGVALEAVSSRLRKLLLIML